MTNASMTGDQAERACATIYESALAVARKCKVRADALDQAWLKRADPRAVQGGAVCEEAQEWHQAARDAFTLCRTIRGLA